MSVTETSRNHYRTFDAGEQHETILRLMREDASRSWCIADVAKSLGMEKSTIAARMNELRNYGMLEHDGKKPSQTTGVTAYHYKIKMQPSLI